jgi:hypothetical protein
LEFALSEIPRGEGNNLIAYRAAKFSVLPLLLRLEDEGERDAALRDVAGRIDLPAKPLRKALADLEGEERIKEQRRRVAEAARNLARKNGEPEGVGEDPVSEEAEELIAHPGVLNRYVEAVASIKGVVRDRDPLRLQVLVALGAQLALLANARPAGSNLALMAEAGRGKNYICDAAAAALPEEFVLAFESASAKSLYYKAEKQPGILKHKWIYPNEAEATDKLVEMFRPLISGGKASHITVNKDTDGRNAAQELNVEGPISITIPTVRNKLDGQLQTRLLVAELPDFEGRVAEHSRALSRLLSPDQAGEDHSSAIRNWRAALRSLTRVRRVVFPLAGRREFCFDADTVNHGARLWGNLLGLMLSHGWLEQRNREVITLENGEEAIVATPSDYEAAYTIFAATCERSVVNLSETHRKILDAIYQLSCENTFEGFSLRKVADAAGVHHSTVAEHRTFLVRSAKLLREVEGGIALVSGAEPSWWSKGDPLVGFPRPEQVWVWWEEKTLSGAETARHARHRGEEYRGDDTDAENDAGLPARQRSDIARHPVMPEKVSGGRTTVSGGKPNGENTLDKPKNGAVGVMSGMSGDVKSEAWKNRRLSSEEAEEAQRLISRGLSASEARAQVLHSS